MDRIAKHSSSEKLVFADSLISISFVSDSLAGPTSVQVIPLRCDAEEATDNSGAPISGRSGNSVMAASIRCLASWQPELFRE